VDDHHYLVNGRPLLERAQSKPKRAIVVWDMPRRGTRVSV
jgi:hypothetical protein